jgi:hypothetical protein
MSFVTHQSIIRTLRPGDQHFQIQDKFAVAQRAGFEITDDCPKDYLCIIQKCYKKGWLKPVANITEREILFIGLTDE